jgi:hypothetical protein
MSLELLNTFGTLTTVVIVAATAIAALVQLRHLRAGNQVNALLSVDEELSSKGFEDAARLIDQYFEAAMGDPLFRDSIIAAARNQKLPEVSSAYAELRQASRLIGNSYENLGILVKRGIVDQNMFLDCYAWVILRDWKKSDPGLALAREASGNNTIWENFEYLAVLSEDWMKSHADGTYPQGVRRMQLTNPWPIVAPATP